jgi:hypothetical protein
VTEKEIIMFGSDGVAAMPALGRRAMIAGFVLVLLGGAIFFGVWKIAAHQADGHALLNGYQYGSTSYDGCAWAVARGVYGDYDQDDWLTGCKLRVDDGGK